MGSYIDTYMRIQTEYRTFKNRWTISSSYDIQAHQQRCQRRCCFKIALQWFEALPDLLPELSGLTPALPGAPKLVVGARSYSEGQQECPPKVSNSPAIDASKFTLHILSHPPGGFQWPNYILLMFQPLCLTSILAESIRHHLARY